MRPLRIIADETGASTPDHDRGGAAASNPARPPRRDGRSYRAVVSARRSTRQCRAGADRCTMGAAPDLTGVVLDGRYRLTRLMGEGGMGQVYEAVHETLDRKVAIKVLLPRFAYDARFRERFLREAKAASKIRHPNVVQIVDFGDTPTGSVYFAMEYLEGQDLRALLQQTGAMPWARARNLLLQITSALAAAHDHGIIHRDLKPANFFISEARGFHDFVKVLDFGIAKITADPTGDRSVAQSLTGTGQVFGTAKYMAPEQAYGSSDDPQVDVYSVGVVAFEILTGRLPFEGSSAFEIITRHVNEAPPSLRSIEPSVPAAVEAVVLHALEKKPEARYRSMDALERALSAIPENVGTRGRIAPALSPNLRRGASRPSAASKPVAPSFGPTRDRAASTAKPSRAGPERPQRPRSESGPVVVPEPAPASRPQPEPAAAVSGVHAQTVIAPAPQAPSAEATAASSGSHRYPVPAPQPSAPISQPQRQHRTAPPGAAPFAAADSGSQPRPVPRAARPPAGLSDASDRTVVAAAPQPDPGHTMAVALHDTSPSGGLASAPQTAATSSSGTPLLVAPERHHADTSANLGSEAMRLGAITASSSSPTAPIQDYGDPRASTGPLDSYPGASVAPETDLHRARPVPSSGNRLLVGMVAVVGMVVTSTVIALTLSDDAPEPAAVETQEIVAVVPDEPDEPPAAAPVEGPTVDAPAADPGPVDPVPALDEPTPPDATDEPEPPDPGETARTQPDAPKS
ncbi:MAG: protein kinase, partial [Nannocystaceae bacterium]